MKEFNGSLYQCGAAYAAFYRREIAGFFSQEFGTYKFSKKYVSACLKQTQRDAPNTYKFLQGLASKSLLTLEQHLLLLLHEEELYHRKLMKKTPHCSAVGVTKNGAVIGQNWDWSTAYHPWSSLNKFRFNKFLRIISLSYPGLPVCAGLNSAGLSLMWTGAGYYPPLCPIIGVPTYALVFEVLLRKDISSALEYLKTVKNAGAFIFFIADAKGNLVLVEAVPGKLIIKHEKAAHRANIFEYQEVNKYAKQKLPHLKKCHSLRRNQVFKRHFANVEKRSSLRSVQEMLSKPIIRLTKGPLHATLVQLVADCKDRKLYVRSWGQDKDSWNVLKI